MCPVSLVRVGESFRQAGLQCIAVRVCGAMCQTLAIYMDCFVACVLHWCVQHMRVGNVRVQHQESFTGWVRMEQARVS